jgi:uncharacterized protein (TIGR00255 family)
MLVSMTGFANKTFEIQNRTIIIEVRSLNSRSFDMKSRLPFGLRSFEIQLRKIIQDKLLRGKIDLVIEEQNDRLLQGNLLDAALVLQLHSEVQAIAVKLNHPAENLLSDVLRLPQISERKDAVYSPENINQIMEFVSLTCDDVHKYRATEGEATRTDLLEAIMNMKEHLKNIEKYEPLRIDSMKARIHNALEQLKSQTEYDRSRFEQEMLYYLEKYDINEEKVRLRQHISYFEEIMQNSETMEKGKKINFISQELGREINTIGSKANYAEIQHLVVCMKEELEKIKEQSANLL